MSLNKVRPRLFNIAPLTAVICWAYGITNMLLGLGMFFIYRGGIAPIAIADIFSYQVWGMIFFSIGILTVLSLLRNSWDFTRQLQLVGLSVKAVWAIALVFRCFESPQTILITVVWLLFAFIQAAVYVYFLPRLDHD